MGAEIIQGKIVRIDEGSRVDVSQPLRQIVDGVFGMPVAIENVEGNLKIRGRNQKSNPLAMVLCDGYVFRTENGAELKPGQRFAAITEDGLVKDYEVTEKGFSQIIGARGINYEAGDGVLVSGVYIKANNAGEWR